MMKKEPFTYIVEKSVRGVMRIVHVVKFAGCLLPTLLWSTEAVIFQKIRNRRIKKKSEQHHVNKLRIKMMTTS